MIGGGRFPDTPCPMCGYLLSGATSFKHPDAYPREGDVSLCIHCAEPSIFVVGPFGVAMRKATADERAEIYKGHGHLISKMVAFKAIHPIPEDTDT